MINPKELIVRLKEKFDNDSRVLAFILVGSQARETVYTANKYSDMEAYVITKDENIEKFEQNLPELVRKMGTVLFSFKHQVGFVTVYDDLFSDRYPVK